MAFKRKYSSRRKTFRKSRRGKFSRKGRSFQSRVKRVLMKAAETKFVEKGQDNIQLYHNVGQSIIVPIAPFIPKSIPNLFNIWADVTPGPGRQERIGDKITPVGMKIQMFLANKWDRPGTMIRVIVARLPKAYNGVVTTSIYDPFQNTGTGNRMILQADADQGVKFLYDRIIRIQDRLPAVNINGSKENTIVLNLWIKRRKGSRPIVYNQNLQAIVNNSIAVYAIPYEQYSTLETDNIASVSWRSRIYYKDL